MICGATQRTYSTIAAWRFASALGSRGSLMRRKRRVKRSRWLTVDVNATCPGQCAVAGIFIAQEGGPDVGLLCCRRVVDQLRQHIAANAFAGDLALGLARLGGLGLARRARRADRGLAEFSVGERAQPLDQEVAGLSVGLLHVLGQRVDLVVERDEFQEPVKSDARRARLLRLVLSIFNRRGDAFAPLHVERMLVPLVGQELDDFVARLLDDFQILTFHWGFQFLDETLGRLTARILTKSVRRSDLRAPLRRSSSRQKELGDKAEKGRDRPKTAWPDHAAAPLS